MRVHELDISNGCQDHTTSPYAATSSLPLRPAWVPPVKGLAKALKRRSSCALSTAHRPKPALRSRLRARRCRVHRIPPHVNDDRDTPLLAWDSGEKRGDLGLKQSGFRKIRIRGG